MKRIVTLFALALSLQLFAQKPIQVEISGKVFNTTADSVIIAQFFGDRYVNYKGAKINRKGEFKIKAELPAKDYYVLRIGEQRLNVILRDSSNIKIYSDAKNVQAYTNIVGSDESVAMNELISRMALHNTIRDSATANFRRYPEREAEINQKFQEEYMSFNAYKQNFIGKNQASPALLPILSTLDPMKDFPTYEVIITQLNKGFADSPSIQAASKQFQVIADQKQSMDFLATGKPAPDFTQNDLKGNPVSLSDLRGKVVLIDFWASWCGPCRKENPNVVKLYNKYKDVGFTILSVSLDDNKTNWENAIQRDGLVWPYHVSDLKKWSNEVAKLYQVSGIPFTVLVDSEGNIIDTKLRGVELEQALKTIFGF